MHDSELKQQLLEAILPHVPFEGWSDVAFNAACYDCKISPAQALIFCPKGAVDLAVLYHRLGDFEFKARYLTEDVEQLRYSEKVAHAIFLRLEVSQDQELIRKASTLFAMPHLAATGAKLIWETADAIWLALGDHSTDANWYSKRMTLSAVYASVVLFWLGDQSDNWSETKAFIARRIDHVMQFERGKSKLKGHRVLGPLLSALTQPLERVQAPRRTPPRDLPGYWSPEDVEP